MSEIDNWLDEGETVLDIAVRKTLSYPGPHRMYPVGVEHYASIDGPYHIVQLLPENSVMIELGSYFGESTMFFWLSGKFKKIYAVDPYEGTDIDNQGDFAPMVENVVKPSNGIVELFRKRSYEAAEFFESGSVDFVYVDALHDYDNVKRDIQVYLPKIKSGGIIAGHDYNPQLFPGCIRAVDEMVGKPDKIYTDTSWMKHIQ